MRTKNPGGSGCDRSDQLLDADNVHEQSKIIHQNRERHLGRDQAMIMSLSRRRRYRWRFWMDGSLPKYEPRRYRQQLQNTSPQIAEF